MLSDAVIILANMRGSYINVGSTVHTLFRMSGRRDDHHRGRTKTRAKILMTVPDRRSGWPQPPHIPIMKPGPLIDDKTAVHALLLSFGVRRGSL